MPCARVHEPLWGVVRTDIWHLYIETGCAYRARRRGASVAKSSIAKSLRRQSYRYSKACPMAFVLLGGSIAWPAMAAPVVLPGAVQPGHERQLSQPSPPPPIDFSIVAPERSAVPRAVDQIHFKLVDLKIEGAVTIP